MIKTSSLSAEKKLILVSYIIFPTVIIFILVDQLPFLSETLHRGQFFGRDAHTFWTAGRILLETGSAQQIYQDSLFTAYKINAYGPDIGWSPYFYPPTALISTALLGLMPYSIAFITYTTLGLFLFSIAISTPQFKKSILILIIAAPMTSINIIMGQNGLISAALLIGGLRLLSIKPAISGVLFGLLAFKPIIGLLIPLLLIIRREWVAFFFSTLTVAITAILPMLIWDTNIWQLFISEAIQTQQNMLHNATGMAVFMTTSAFNSGRLLSQGVNDAYITQFSIAAIAVVLFIIHFKNKFANDQLNTKDILIFSLTTTLISPYIHNYDFTIIEASILLYCFNYSRESITPPTLLVIIICWSIGLFSVLLNMAKLPITPAIIILAIILIIFDKRKKHGSLVDTHNMPAIITKT